MNNYMARKDAETKQQIQMVENIIQAKAIVYPTPPQPKVPDQTLDFASGRVRDRNF